MAIEQETTAQVNLEETERESKIDAFLSSGYANEVAGLAIAAYWDHLQAKRKVSLIETDIRIEPINTEHRPKSYIKALQASRDEANAEADILFRTAADYAAIAGAIAIVKSEQPSA